MKAIQKVSILLGLSFALTACTERDMGTGEPALDRERAEERADQAKERVDAQAEARKAEIDADKAEVKAEAKAAEERIHAELKQMVADNEGWSRVRADFDDGVVTLKGKVATDAERTEIETRVKGIHGVTVVKNEIEIGE
jgi:osmotically-inducible protein OsmY